MAWGKLKRSSRVNGRVVNANFNPNGNCNVNWNLKPDNANDNLGVRSVIVSGISGRHLLKRCLFFMVKINSFMKLSASQR
ncbi:MAG: hypothetical protein UV41_C0020G0016 [Candidatus Daviesbacteria bacterium GW2011_GWA2_42_7]|uniref:Uncharacterized protein n=2 Tax=Candidatus Daviesiibacteriota TaxID=1752718 RepID=A0A0G1AUF2_9BACT|nr:MAG: hypothetical protein UV33_C0021G0006 [Candidatus Daviesbacteria bacterium GW2011_GWA1_42_6]KKS70537.1 MAG: hypothetical protein UV41_C0020G0016 [Candidatus Daviesbacteria bacterium GW2011_GWA2_42_7]